MDQTLEQWRPVVGYEGRYEVSSFGRVRSVARTCSTKGGARRTVPARMLSAYTNTYGYQVVNLAGGTNASIKQFHVGHLVAAAFLGPRPEGYHVAHGINGKLDNSIDNLSYKRPKENMADKVRDGTHNRGERHRSAKLTEAQVAFARKAVLRGYATRTDLACAWGVSVTAMCDAVKGTSWWWLNA